MSTAETRELGWAERAADQSVAVQRSRARQIEQAKTIVDAAHRLIAERGERFTTQELVKEAGVALQTFYRLFPGKDQLLLAVLEDMIAENCAQYEEAARRLPDPVARLRFYITAALRSIADDDPMIAGEFHSASQARITGRQQYPALWHGKDFAIGGTGGVRCGAGGEGGNAHAGFRAYISS